MDRRRHVPDAFDHSRYLIKLFSSSYPAGNSRENHVFRWFDFSFAPLPKGASTRVSPDVALLKLSLPSFRSKNVFSCSFHKHLQQIHTQTYVFIHMHNTNKHLHRERNSQIETHTPTHTHEEKREQRGRGEKEGERRVAGRKKRA